MYQKLWGRVKYLIEHIRITYLRAGDENEHFNKLESYQLEVWAFRRYKNELIVELEKLEDELIEKIHELENK